MTTNPETHEERKADLTEFYGPLTGNMVRLYLDGQCAPKNWATLVMTRDVGNVIEMSNPSKHGLRLAKWDACFQAEVEDALIEAIAECSDKRKRQSLEAFLARVMTATGKTPVATPPVVTPPTPARIEIKGIKAGAAALDIHAMEGGLITELIEAGLEITNTSISFPVELLNSVTYAVCDKWDIFDDDREYLSAPERNEYMALGRLADRLKKMGGKDRLDPPFDK